MPQVHNKSLSMDQDASAFNKNSRYMASLRFTDASMKRANVLNALERRMETTKATYYKKDLGNTLLKMDRVKERLLDNFNKRMAYKLVLKRHNIATAKDYSKALDKRYSFESMQSEVRFMMLQLKPEAVRRQKAKAMIAANRKRYDNLIKNNWEEIERRFPVKKWQAFSLPSREKTKDPDPTPLPPIEDRNKRGLATLRRRIITLDDSKPTSPRKTPIYAKQTIASPMGMPKQSSASPMGMVKRQGITMSMMKKQKSFLENAEKTDLTDNYKLAEKVAPIDEAGPMIKSPKEASPQKIEDDTTETTVDIKAEESVETVTELTKKLTVLPPINRNLSATDKVSDPKTKKKQKRLSIGEDTKIKLPSLKMSGGNNKMSALNT